MNRLKFKLEMFLIGFPCGIRAKVELGEKFNLWDRLRYWILTREVRDEINRR
jgi:hypothetical protein